MGNNKVHTKAQMQGKKGNGKNDLHPKSRRVKQAVRVELRTKRIGESKKERDAAEEEKANRLRYFIDTMDQSLKSLNMDGMHKLAVKFCDRHNEGIATEAAQRRPGRTMSKRQEELETAKKRDEHEYAKEGLLMPDLSIEESVASSRYWHQKLEGKGGYFKRLRLVRIFKGSDDLVLVQEGAKLGTKALEAGFDPDRAPSDHEMDEDEDEDSS